MFGRILRWLRKPEKPEPSPNPFPPDDPRREAFDALWAYAQARRKRARSRPSTEPREVVLHEVPDDVLLGSRDLLKQYRDEWAKAPPEKRNVIFLLPEATRNTLQQEAGRAAAEIERELRRRGVKDRVHYYSAGERAATGEVDRTYDTHRAKPLDGLGDSESGDQKP